ncbi:hypothetical protein MUA04_24130 [Enterobacteriaceae bacterium H11S18]|uniref:hypothetical protein n=1 Tax=Dryocola clanedunensis TaxID=2925396 RepID=UPI0022F0FCB9|nr:hypothetical protein [Dryocola clanedunensis]MCT4713261.1 hypothetical protein [Dryocola clanedunensis]
MKILIIFIATFMSFGASAGGYTAYCGPYTVTARLGEMDIINGERVTSQKITNIGSDGVRIDMGLMPSKDGNNYGFQYIHYPNSEKRFLNVQLLQASADGPKVIGSFPCKKILN